MKLLLPLLLAFVSPLAFAAVGISIEGLVELVVWLIVVGLIVGLLLYLVAHAPFIPEDWKTWIKYVIYFVCILLIINFLLGFIGHPLFTLK
jgi:hypothetical protein